MPLKRVSAGRTSAHRARESVKLLCRKKPCFIPLDFWHPNSPFDYQLMWMTIQISTTMMNRHNGWFRSCAILTRTISTRLLTSDVRLPARVRASKCTMHKFELYVHVLSLFADLHSDLASTVKQFRRRAIRHYVNLKHIFTTFVHLPNTSIYKQYKISRRKCAVRWHQSSQLMSINVFISVCLQNNRLRRLMLSNKHLLVRDTVVAYS